jgi:RNA polymerase sigma factor (sigma-70 family)
VLGDVHAAEDALQATFLVLARRAAVIRPRGAVAAWLHGVARRVASKARAREARRRAREPRAAVGNKGLSESPLDRLSARELLQLLDEEVARLPHRYRLPVVLCCLEGRSQEAAAQVLGWTPGSVKGRLERGRALLRTRLTRRGVEVAAALLACGLGTTEASAAWTAGVAASTVRAATAFAAGRAVTDTRVADLARSALRGLPGNRAKLLVALLLTAALCGGGVRLLGGMDAVAEPPSEEAAQKAEGQTPPAHADLRGDPLPAGARVRLGSVRFRPPGNVQALSLLPDGVTALVVARDDTHTDVSLWDTVTGQRGRQIAYLDRFPCFYGYPAVSQDGSVVAVAEATEPTHYRVRVLDVASGKEIQSFQTQKTLLKLALAPDGKRLAGVASDYLRIWDGRTSAEVFRYDSKGGEFVGIAISPDGKTLAAAGAYGEVRLWNTDTGREIRRFAPAQPDLLATTALAFAPDGATLVVSGGLTPDPIVRQLDIATGKVLRVFHAGGRVESLAFTADGRTLATADWGPNVGTTFGRSHIRLWDVATGQEKGRLDERLTEIGALAFSADGKTLVAGGEGAIGVWDVAGGKFLTEGIHDGPVDNILYFPDGRTLATAGTDGIVGVWEAATGRLVRRFAVADGKRVLSVASAPDGRTLATGDYDGTVRLLDPVNGREVRKWAARGGPVLHTAFAPDGRSLVTGGRNGIVQMWDPASGRETGSITDTPGPGHQVTFAAFNPDGKLLVFAREITFVGAWNAIRVGSEFIVRDLASGKEVSKWQVRDRYFDMAFAPDGRSLAGVASPSDSARFLNFKVSILDTAGAVRRHLPMPNPSTFDSHCYSWFHTTPSVAFSIDGRMLAGGTADGAVYLLELSTGRVRRWLPGHRSVVSSVAFAPNGRTIAAGCRDSTALVVNVLTPGDGARRPTEARLQELWEDLAGADATKAFDAVTTLVAYPEESIPYLKERLATAKPPDLARLVAELDNDQFATREAASGELARLGESAAVALRAALNGSPSAELRRRVEMLLAKLKPDELSAESLRSVRLIEALEYAAKPEARALLKTAAAGDPGARLTREAKASLDRLEVRARRGVGSPASPDR